MYRTLGNVITPSRFVKPYTKGIFLHGRRIFLKYKDENIRFRTFYISKGFTRNGERIPKGLRSFNPPREEREDSSKWRRIDFLPKDIRSELKFLAKDLGHAVIRKTYMASCQKWE